jgi:FixJ family two-component response regulator
MEAEDYIEKPVDTKKLLETVRSFF